MTEPPPERRRPTASPAHTDSPLEEAHDTPFEVVTVHTRPWGEQGGSYSPDRLYRWRYEWILSTALVPKSCATSPAALDDRRS